jgi:stress-induced morphogen
MVFISAMSFFIMAFYVFETHGVKTAKKIKQQQAVLQSLKEDYYFAMTAEIFDVMALPKYFTESMDSTHYKIKVVSDNMLTGLFVIRKK